MPLYIIPQRYALRGATAAELAARNEVLLDREFCQETDTKRFKLGDGSTRWLDLPYAGWGGADLTDLADGDALIYDATLGMFVPGNAGGVADASAASRLFGRGSAGGAGPWEEITLGTGLSMSGTTLSSSGGAMTLVGTATVAGSAATTLTISGLDLTTDGQYVVEAVLKNTSGANSNISLYYNSDTTATNYDTARVLSHTTINPARANDAIAFALTNNLTTNASGRIRLDFDGKASSIWHAREQSTAIQFRMAAHLYRTATNITGITLSSSAANGFAVGSYIKVWKVTG